MELEFKLQVFEGPLDLLLHLLDKNKVSIYDIPIVEITNQYMEYIRQMQKHDLNVVSEFMVMAATLLDIKSKMLLPADPTEEEDEEDPRAELVQQLLEYKLYKCMAFELKDCQVDASHIFYKEPTVPEEVLAYTPPIDTKELVSDLTLNQLNDIFKSVLKRQKDKIDPIRSKFGEIRKEEVSLEDKMGYLSEYAGQHKNFSFRQLLEKQSSKMEVIVTFLAILELMKSGKILISQEHTFDDILIDRSFPEDHAPTRKPRTGMLTKYIDNPEYDLAGSFVIGDRPTDVELAKNLGCRAIYLQDSVAGLQEKGLEEVCTLATTDWDRIAEFLFAGERKAEVRRTTKETDIYVALNLDGNGNCNIATGLGFFDHMLEQIGKHSGMDLTIQVKGDLEVDEHHTIEDTAIALGDCIYQALGSKRGIERYGYALPMDDCLCQVCLDFGGRPWLVWDAEFKREKIGEMPTEMFLHFFKSLSDAAKMNLNIKAEGQNEHHKIEGIFKALARALKMALKRDIYHFELPSSKGVL